MAADPTNGTNRQRTYHVGRAYDQAELKTQEYRKLSFATSVVTAAIGVTAVLSVVTLNPFAGALCGVAVVVRAVMAVMKVYYEKVYLIHPSPDDVWRAIRRRLRR